MTPKDTPPPPYRYKPYHDFQNFVANFNNSGVFWVTKPCHSRAQDPRFAQVISPDRMILSEVLIEFATCEIDNAESSLTLID
ncbi:hypothetical protein ACJQWK_00885 [Exserohilum turcicum]